MRPRGTQTDQIVIDGTLVGGVEVLADVDPDDSVPFAPRNIDHAGSNTGIVESHAVYDGFLFHDPEESRLVVPRLRPRRQGSDFDMPESDGAKAIDGFARLVESGS